MQYWRTFTFNRPSVRVAAPRVPVGVPPYPREDQRPVHQGETLLKNAPDLRTVWLIAMGEVEKLGVHVTLAAWGGNSCENTWLYHLISSKGYLHLPKFVVGFWDPYNSARLSKKCVFPPDNLPLEDGKKRSSPPGVGEAYRIHHFWEGAGGSTLRRGRRSWNGRNHCRAANTTKHKTVGTQYTNLGRPARKKRSQAR